MTESTLARLARRAASIVTCGGLVLAGIGVSASPSFAATSTTHCSIAKASSVVSNARFPATASGSSNCRLNTSTASNNAAVRTLQTNLNYCYGENLLVDGNFGSLTAAALRRAQADEGILVDGWYGNESRDHLAIVSLGQGTGPNVCRYNAAR